MGKAMRRSLSELVLEDAFVGHVEFDLTVDLSLDPYVLAPSLAYSVTDESSHTTSNNLLEPDTVRPACFSTKSASPASAQANGSGQWRLTL